MELQLIKGSYKVNKGLLVLSKWRELDMDSLDRVLLLLKKMIFLL